MVKIIGFIEPFYQYTGNIIFCFKHYILRGKRMNTRDSGIFLYFFYQAIIFSKRRLFGNYRFKRLLFLYADMTPETEHFLAYLQLKSIGKSQGNDHDRYADNSGADR